MILSIEGTDTMVSIKGKRKHVRDLIRVSVKPDSVVNTITDAWNVVNLVMGPTYAGGN